MMVLFIILLTLTLASPAFAQEDDSYLYFDQPLTFILEDIIVSARKRNETLHDVPISIEVISGQEIIKKSIGNLEELSSFVPNVHVGQAGLGEQLFIRGIGSGVNTGFEQTVGTFVDGIYYGRGQLARSPLFDIERVEVLKGPQSLYFGKNTIAGAFSISTINPTDDYRSSISSLYEPNHKEKKLEGFISGSITSSTSARLSFRAYEIEGWLENGHSGANDEPFQEDRAIRLGLSYSGFDNLFLVGKLTQTEFNTVGRNKQTYICSDALKLAESINGLIDDCSKDNTTWDGGSFVPASNSANSGTGIDYGKQKSDTDTTNFSLNASFTAGEFEFTSLTGYNAFQYYESVDSDYSPLSFIQVELIEDFSQLSQEIRMAYLSGDNIEWLLGFYVQKTILDVGGNFYINLLQIPSFPMATGGFNGSMDQDSISWAIFGDWQYQYNEMWSAILGARFTRETKDAHKQLYITNLGSTSETSDENIITTIQAFGFIPHNFSDQRTENNFTPSAILKFSPDINSHYYLSSSKGFKGGGYDALLTSGEFDNFEYEEEQVTSYEIGAKYILFDETTYLQFALFRSEFKDIQTSVFDGDSDNVSFIVGNAGQIRTQGLEITSQARLSQIFTLDFSYAFLDSTYSKFDGTTCYSGQTVQEGCIGARQSLSGETTPFSPKNTANISISAAFSVMGNTLSTIIDLYAISDYTVATDLDPLLDQEGFTKINLRLGYGTKNGGGNGGNNWEIALVGKNLTDKQTSFWANDIAFFPGSYFIMTDRERSIALQFSASY